MKIFTFILFFKFVYSVPTDEFHNYASHGPEVAVDDEPLTPKMKLVPGELMGQATHKHYKIKLDDLVDKDTEEYKILNEIIENGYAMKGLTFSLYDDDMRDVAVALFRLFQTLEENTFHEVVEWAKQNVNEDVLEYAWRLLPIFTDKFRHLQSSPRFITKPNYFINSETISKAYRLKLNNDYFNPQEAKVNQFYKTDKILTINSNYSNWNTRKPGCMEKINYFREDIGLNNYYYGLNLLYPFWMSNDEIEELHPKSIENFYYAHQQLLARYRLEQEHLRYQNEIENVSKCDKGYDPYLNYDNGLPFPYRHKISDFQNDDVKIYIAKTVIGIRESIARNFIIVDRGSKKVNTTMSEEVLAKLIRGNIDGIKSAKVLRAYYGSNGYPVDEYNPAPSVFHHSETSLRDPLYWHLIECVLKYFLEYKKKARPFDLSYYEANSIKITVAEIPHIHTYFDYYEFDITGAMSNKNNFMKFSTTYTARQRRLNHLPFELNFTIESKVEGAFVVRLFLAPQCEVNECFEQFSKFYRLDQFQYELRKGENIISWSSYKSNHLSSDDIYNFVNNNKKNDDEVQEYNMFKFPRRLLIPKGHEDGLNYTLFIIVTQIDDDFNLNSVPALNDSYQDINSQEIDNKPIGFPFHRFAENYSNNAYNYKFYNISVYHDKNEIDRSGVFSSHLY